MSKSPTDPGTPEFHLHVTRRPGQGPIGPYRLTLSIGFSLVVTGLPLWHAMETGDGLDEAMLRTGAAGVLMWVLSGSVNRILAAASVPPTKSTPIAFAADESVGE